MEQTRSLHVLTATQADSADCAAKLIRAPTTTGVILKDFVKACGCEDLLAWAREYCSIGEPVKDQLLGGLVGKLEPFSLYMYTHTYLIAYIDIYIYVHV